MPTVATANQLAAMRRKGQFSDLYVAVFKPNTIFSARLNAVPSTTDMIAEIDYTSGVGTYGDVKPDMTLWVGTSAGAYDLGMIRIRKAATATKLFIGEQSKIDWQASCYLTVVDDFDLKAKHIHISDAGVPLMDYDIAYSDQHTSFNPVPVLGPIVRVGKLEGASVALTLGPEQGYTSWVFDSTISSYLWSCATATFDATGAAKPTATFTTVGWHVIYCTVTAANGKTKQGVRYVYIWSEASPPYKISDVSLDESQDAGGGNFSVTFPANADIANIPDRALCVLFSVNRYDSYSTGTQDNVGMDDAENIEYIGRIMGESITYDAMRSEVSFEVQGFQEWFKRIPGFPTGLELAVNTPAAWTDMPALTVDRAIWHLLEWRSTATRMMDVIVTNDTRYAVELSSLSNSLWSQMEEIAFSSIFAFPCVDMYGRFFLQIEPQLTPEASRSFVNVMTITSADYHGSADIQRVITPEISQVDFSGIVVDISGNPSSLFSLAPGHVPQDYGSLELGDKYLLADQAGANVIAGLILAWKNNPYKPITLNLLNNKMISCFPNQFVSFTLSASDTIRGVGYSGRLIPIRRSLNYDKNTGAKSYTVDFESEVLEGVAIDGDIPGSDTDSSIQPLPSFPPLPPLPVFFPGVPSSTPDGPPTVLLLDDTKGLLVSKNFNKPNAEVRWEFNNAGIPAAEVDDIQTVFMTPSGSIWLVTIPGAFSPTSGGGVYYSQGIGGIFKKVVGWDFLNSEYPNTQYDIASGGGRFFAGLACNPNKPEEIGLIAGGNNFGPFVSEVNFWIGDRNGFTKKAACPNVNGNFGSMSFGGGKWILLNEQFTFFAFWDSRLWRFSADGATKEYEVGIDSGGAALLQKIGRASTTERFYFWNIFGNKMYESPDNGTTITLIGDAKQTGGDIGSYAISPTGQYMLGSWDSGLKGLSSDYGATWAGLPSLPPGGAYCFAYAGGDGSASRWIAARGVVRYSPDFGTTWQNKEGNINYLIPTGLTIRKILIPGYANG